jgi:hypothetical protein
MRPLLLLLLASLSLAELSITEITTDKSTITAGKNEKRSTGDV